MKKYGIGILTGMILGVSSMLGGTTVAIGDISWVYCAEVGSGYRTTASGE